MVAFSKVVTYVSSVLFAGYLINRVYDSYSEYVAEEGYKVEDIFGGGSQRDSQSSSSRKRGGAQSRGGSSAGGRGSQQQQQRGGSKQQQQQDPAMLKYQGLRRLFEETVQDEEYAKALVISEEMYELVQSSPLLASQDGNALYTILRLASVTKNHKKLAQYAPRAIELMGPNPYGEKLMEIVDMVDLIVKDKLEEKKYDEAIATIKMYLKKYNTYRPENVATLYGLLAAVYRQMDSQQEYEDAIQYSVEMARKSNDQNTLASALVDILEFQVNKGKLQLDDVEEEEVRILILTIYLFSNLGEYEKVDKTIEELLPLFPTNEQKLTIFRVMCPILLAGKYLSKYVEVQREIVEIFSNKLQTKFADFVDDDKVKLVNHLLRENICLASALVLVGNEDEAMEMYNKVKHNETLVYTLSTFSKYYKTKEASIDLNDQDQFVFSVKIEVPEYPQEALTDDLVAICKFENPQFVQPNGSTIVVDEVKSQLIEDNQEIKQEQEQQEQEHKTEEKVEEENKAEEENKVASNLVVDEVKSQLVEDNQEIKQEQEEKKDSEEQQEENKTEEKVVEEEKVEEEKKEEQQPQEEEENKTEGEEKVVAEAQPEEETKILTETIDVEKKAEKVVTFEAVVGKIVEPTKAFLATIYIYKGDDRENVLSKHIQVISPRIPSKGLPDKEQQKAYY
ncbi:hypothetical protein DFA_05408 [Cavenderia fasciculata]|uniref:Tetratricopeptide-like helical domain-containing protein n=1 Tax=Cavenderia fasciculata TaxID=261658 RepID=F4PL54_CACFS|nr:uncharacterized protein DFA_05408 [Cavenderia fasciculata]EGG23276.1 hypothetical protein DFA_05408 [Cavenderia fasciculata]|eukprot:XP_004361127.1 hypothetical protein DFA_05408 [Cavenderia fasciculata]